MGVLLWFISLILSIIVIPLGIIIGIISDCYNHQISVTLRKASVRFRAMAVATDKYGNIACPELFQFFLITKKSLYPFGNPLDTISYVLGVNKDGGTLTGLGKLITSILIKFKDPLNK